MNCTPTPSQVKSCSFWNGLCCADKEEYVNRETGEPMCRFNSSSVHVNEYRNSLKTIEAQNTAHNPGSPKLPADCAACALRFICKGSSIQNTMACRGARSQLRASA